MGLRIGMEIINEKRNGDGEYKILLKSDPLSSFNMSKLNKGSSKQIEGIEE